MTSDDESREWVDVSASIADEIRAAAEGGLPLSAEVDRAEVPVSDLRRWAEWCEAADVRLAAYHKADPLGVREALWRGAEAGKHDVASGLRWKSKRSPTRQRSAKPGPCPARFWPWSRHRFTEGWAIHMTHGEDPVFEAGTLCRDCGYMPVLGKRDERQRRDQTRALSRELGRRVAEQWRGEES